MTEHSPSEPEQLAALDETTELLKTAGIEELRERPESTPSAETDLQKIRQKLEGQAQSAKSEKIELADLDQPETVIDPHFIDSTTRKQSLQRILKNVRRQLPGPQRGLSHIIHQPTVDTLSELGSKTVARPSGILGGGICALTGSLAFVYYAKHVGFRYNYLLFGMLFVAGFVVGLIIEIILRLLLRSRRSL